MTIKEKKRILKDYNALDERIEQMRRDREKCLSYDTYRSPLGNEFTGGKPSGTVIEVTVEKRAEDWDALIGAEIEKLYSLRTNVETALASLANGTEQTVLRLLYLGVIDDIGERHCLKVPQIAYKLGYSERQIHRIQKAALLHLPDIK